MINEKYACLKVVNLGAERLKNCTAQILREERLERDGWVGSEQSMYLHWMLGEDQKKEISFQTVAYIQVASIKIASDGAFWHVD